MFLLLCHTIYSLFPRYVTQKWQGTKWNKFSREKLSISQRIPSWTLLIFKVASLFKVHPHLLTPIGKNLPQLPGISLALGPGPPATRLIPILPESELLSPGYGRVCQQNHQDWALALHRGSPSKSLCYMRWLCSLILPVAFWSPKPRTTILIWLVQFKSMIRKSDIF